MSAERPSEATVEALAKVLADYSGALSQIGAESLAGNVLASDWLAAHDAQVRADRDRDWQVAIERLASLCAKVIEVHANVVMDTPEDRDLHDRAVETFRRHLRALAPDVAGEGQEE